MKPIVRSPKADADLDAIVDHLITQSVTTAARFIDAADDTIRSLSEAPEIGGTFETDNPRLRGLRVWPVKGFPNHLIFYRVREAVEIVRVLHGARDLEHLE